jgi:preprotein translocase subunit SecD
MKRKLGWKIWLLIIAVAFSIISIFGIPPALFQKGVLITSVDSNSTAFDVGLRQGQIITAIDGVTINNLNDFSNVIKDKYISNESVKTVIDTKESEFVLYTNEAPQITVSDIPKTNIKFWLDLEGGSRALVQAKDKKLTADELNDLIDITSNRLNEFGLTDLKVLPVSDLSGNHFMLIEIAGATPNDLEDLISKQGKFEAKIGNDTVFVGGNKDISSVCRNDARCAGIESCQSSGEGYVCEFRFAIYLSEAAARRQASLTNNLTVNLTNPEYLSKKLDLYLDDKLVDSLLISEGLKGQVTTQISISGSGTGATQSDAYEDATNKMHQLQTILITGSLPYQLEIVKLDTISPLLGKEFTTSILLAGLVAIFAVAFVLFLRYRRFRSSLAVLVTCLSEIIIIFGIAAFIGWNIDLPSLAGILATIGTGVDDQIVILDESRHSTNLSLKQRLKRAFAIIFGSYFTTVVSLLPLVWAGAGLLKGFAITTIIGISVGVLITRPAFAEIVKRVEE